MTARQRPSFVRAIYAHRVILKRILVAGFIILVLSLLILAITHVEWVEVLDALKKLPVGALVWAGVFAVLTYCVYSCFDLIGKWYTGHRLMWWRSVLVGFISYAFTMSLGSTVGGVGMRIRLYTKQGLRQGVILRVWAMSVTTNWTGYLVMLGIVFLTAQVDMPAKWAIGEPLLRIVGALCLGLVAAYILASRYSARRSWSIRGHDIELPDARLALLQSFLGAAGWLLMGTVLYVLFQHRIPYFEVLGIVLISAVAGLAARIPGGLGVIEYVFITMLSGTIPRSETLAVLLVYRLFYYIMPLLLAGLCYLVAEMRLKPVSRQRST